MENLSKKLDEIINRLDLLEKMILENPEHKVAAAAVGRVRLSITVYGEPLKLAARLKNAESYLRRKQSGQDTESLGEAARKARHVQARLAKAKRML